MARKMRRKTPGRGGNRGQINSSGDNGGGSAAGERLLHGSLSRSVDPTDDDVNNSIREELQPQHASGGANSIGGIISKGIFRNWRKGSIRDDIWLGGGCVEGEGTGSSQVEDVSRRGRVVAALRNGDAGEIARICIQPGGLGFLSASATKKSTSKLAQCCAPSSFSGDDDDALRAKAWLLLLSADAFSCTGPASTERLERSVKTIRDEFNMDILRSMYGFGCCRALPMKGRDIARERLAALVTGVLQAQPAIYYYQGFHDVCTVFLHVFRSRPDTEALFAAEQMATQVFADHHRSDFSTTIKIMDLVLVVLQRFDSAAHTLLSTAGVGPMFALSWVITGFAHSVPDAAAVARIYDALLAAHPLLPAYLCAAVVSRPHTRKQLFNVAKAAGAENCMPELHHALQTVAVPTLSVVNDGKSKRASSRARRRRYRRQSKKSAIVADTGGVMQEARFPTSCAEEAENNVDLLVETAMAMMCVYPPEQVCRDYNSNASNRVKSSKGSNNCSSSSNNVGVPAHSVVMLPIGQKKHWVKSMEYVKETSVLVDELSKQSGILDHQRNIRLYYFGLATVIGITAVASSWFGNYIEY